MKLIFSFIVLLFVWSNLCAQSTAVYKERAGKAYFIGSLLSQNLGLDCSKRQILIGRIVKRDYSEDEITISGFVLKSAQDKRTSVNIDLEATNIWGRESNRIVSEALSLNSRVRVVALQCSGGGSGVFLFASSVSQF